MALSAEMMKEFGIEREMVRMTVVGAKRWPLSSREVVVGLEAEAV